MKISRRKWKLRLYSGNHVLGLLPRKKEIMYWKLNIISNDLYFQNKEITNSVIKKYPLKKGVQISFGNIRKLECHLDY